MRQPVHIVWFKKDLRVYDHAALKRASLRGPALPLYIVEPDLWSQPDMSGRHYAFLLESLDCLRNELARLGQPLIIRTGPVTSVLESIRSRYPVAGLWSHEETGNAWTYERDKQVAAWCRNHGVPWTECRQTGVIRGLINRNGWASRWDGFMGEMPVDAPQLSPLEQLDLGEPPAAQSLGLADDACPGRQTGGRRAAFTTLQSFLHERGKSYRAAMATPLKAFSACSRLSPYFAFGTLSLREAAQATWERQRDLKKSDFPGRTTWQGAMQSFSGRLHWHCHFMQKLENEPRLEFENLHKAYDGLRPEIPNRERLTAWQDGETGLPFVDACMRALTATGWMNFRMRAMLVAVSSYHLWLDWRQPGLHLARLFTDYEPGIHWPQVQMQSGTTGINTIRIYNPIKQGIDQDPDGQFVRQWLPELIDIDTAFIHTPWKAPNAGKVLGKSYPFPVVDYLSAAKQAREKVWAIRKSNTYVEQARGIQDRHGSRKSGIPMRGATTARKKSKPAHPDQKDLFG
ncbi:deoxyribodipyrimidine photo-lyase [Roseibium denhamense]|uniref:Deoxyribodipyrimidine photo-lyase family protein (Cryptochrome) n=1 Tax=Roseibium denhamense TaxID=76305 RepID=A0ABY1PL17_9HYPH|nr:deoxyribodipyrimidine photo-lyase [Roseibium denhamense]MTI07028.1 deoxyribodipyrimidine photo-lyase [Roseibium denhamense]SMP36554.1 deoxyribodipyrimidine photo-lyase family protein (cryptochrome) [Roseibium denhamense]